MIDVTNNTYRPYLFKGKFGLEKESLRITEDGFFAQTKHPFTGSNSIVRDFCENQVEVNTAVHTSIEDAISELVDLTVEINKKLSSMDNPELMWPFSNPPFIRRESDIPIAQFTGDFYPKTQYREYLSERYGRYKMSLSGIHINYSFCEDLLHLIHGGDDSDYQKFKDSVCLELARKLTLYGWLITNLTSASPLLDNSYNEKGNLGGSFFSGMSSVRCSELGYWNHFVPVFNYSDAKSYADSIRSYVKDGYLAYPSELYYPIRLKPYGDNNIDKLASDGISHIELRMVDNNPLTPVGLDIRDVKFIHLFIIYLMSLPAIELSNIQQVASVQNFKNAAHYDLKTVNISMPGYKSGSMVDVGVDIINSMQEFYDIHFKGEIDYEDILKFELDKLIVPENRYSWIIKDIFAGDYVKKGIELAKKYQTASLSSF